MTKSFSESSPIIIYGTDTTEVVWDQRNKKIYTSLGYKFTEYGDSFFVLPEHLSQWSKSNVNVACPLCGESRWIGKNKITRRKHSYCKRCSRAKNILGNIFGKLTPKKWVRFDHACHSIWEFDCECGNSHTCRANSVLTGTTTSCGCFSREFNSARIIGENNYFYGKSGRKNAKFVDLSGKRFERLLVTSIAEEGGGVIVWNCLCDCGAVVTIPTSSLASGNTKSCGCYHLDRVSGENNHNWDSSLTDEDRNHKRITKEYTDWRSSVYYRDGFKCVMCGKEKNMHAHHILSYKSHPDQRYNIHNGISLCPRHHREFHSIYGGGNNSGSQLLDYMNGRYYKSAKDLNLLYNI